MKRWESIEESKEVLEAAVGHAGSRTALLYFVVAFLIVTVLAVVMEVVAVVVIVALIELILVFLLCISIFRKGDERLFSPSYKTHLLSLFFASVFAVPFVGVASVIKHSMNLVVILCFGYSAMCLIVTVPTVIIISEIKDAKAKKNK